MDPQSLNSVDEDLVAAYVDGDVTTEERQRVEAAMAASEQVAWEVNTLRQTVELLQDLPSVPLPRSFTLTEDQVADVLEERRALAKVNPSPPRNVETAPESPWQRFLDFLNGGDLALRNAAALAAVLLLLVFAAEFQIQQSQLGPAAGGEQLSSAPAEPQGQVTAIGGSVAEQAGSSSDQQGTSEQVAVGENGQENADDDPVIGVMSTSEEDQQTTDAEQAPVAALPETGSAATDSSQQQLSPTETADPAAQPFVSILRYARILLVLAVIVLWLLSRTRSRSRRA